MAITVEDEPSTDIVDERAVPNFGDTECYELPECPQPSLAQIVQANQDLFRTTPGAAYHYIPTTGTPVRVPPLRIPAHYRTEVKCQIQDMLRQDIIEESCSPWMAPAVFVRKKTGELRMCVDYREVNKQTSKDAYPLSLVDEVLDRLSGSTRLARLTYEVDIGRGRYTLVIVKRRPFAQVQEWACTNSSKCMPFGLAGTPSSFQQLMDKLFRDLPFVTCYLDDVLVHSSDVMMHGEHLREVICRLQEVLFILEIWCGSLYQLLENLTHAGKVAG